MIKKILLGLLIVILLAAAGFVIWGSNPLKPMPEALAALQSDSAVQVKGGEWTVFMPFGKQPDIALIFYPGGRVDYRAYAPYLHAIAGQGYLVILTPMPLSLAVFSPNRAGDVIKAYPEIKHWVIGGHSLGGAMAAHYAAQHPQQIEGLVLFAAYPASSDSLAALNTKVISIHGSQDGLATPAKIEASRPLLPSATQFITIEGGNHAQFGWYGLQDGDGTAAISPEEQQSQVVNAVVKFLQDFAGK